VFLQGSYSVSAKIASGKYGWIYYNYGSGLNFTTTYAGQYVYIWLNCTTLGSLDTLANEGLSIRIGSSTANYDCWLLGGSDGIGNSYTGGWLCAVIDPTEGGNASLSGGTGLDTTAVQYIGVHMKNPSGGATIKSENIMVDTIAVGSGLSIKGTEATAGDGWTEVKDYCIAYASRAWGMIQERGGILYAYGNMTIGDSAQSANTSFTDTAQVVRFGDFYYHNGTSWVTSITSGFHGLTVEDAASYTTVFQDGTIVGTDAGRSGSTFIGADDADTTFDLYGGSNSSSTTKLYGTTLRGIDGAITWGNDADHHCYSVVMEGCAQFDPVGAVRIRNCNFIATLATDAAVVWNANIDIESCNFIANTTGSGIEHTSAAGSPYTYTSLLFSGNTYDVNNTSGSAITITKAGTPPSDPSTSQGSSVTYQSSITLTITVQDESTSPVVTAQVAIYKISDRTQLMNEDTDSNGVATESYVGAGEDVEIRIRKSSTGDTKYIPFSTRGTLTSENYSLLVTLKEDQNA
jgi:hypothetical protein